VFPASIGFLASYTGLPRLLAALPIWWLPLLRLAVRLVGIVLPVFRGPFWLAPVTGIAISHDALLDLRRGHPGRLGFPKAPGLVRLLAQASTQTQKGAAAPRG